MLDSQTQSSDSIQAWAAHLATVTKQLQTNDSAVAGHAAEGRPSGRRGARVAGPVAPTLPIVLANLVSVGQVAVTYRDNLEALLVELPQGAADIQAIGVANRTPSRTTSVPT